MKFVKNEDAVSPVIGVILMVAITVILAAVIAAFVFNLGGTTEKAPTASIVVANNPDTGTPDLKISQKGGDLLKGGDFKLSVVPAASGASPEYVTSNSSATGDLDFSVGGQIKVAIETTGCGLTNCTLNNSALTNLTASATPLKPNTKYDVKLVHIPSNAMLVDTVVEVR